MNIKVIFMVKCLYETLISVSPLPALFSYQILSDILATIPVFDIQVL